MSLITKGLWRVGPLPKPLASIIHFQQSRNLLYQQQSRDISTIPRGKRIHVAGAHRLQTLIANGILQSAKNPLRNPVTLMVPNNDYIRQYVDTDGKIQMIQDGIATTIVGAVDMEVLPFSMEFSVPPETFPPAKNLKYKRLLMDTALNEDDSLVDDVSSLLNNVPRTLDLKKKATKPARLPISDMKVCDLSYFLELNASFCEKGMGKPVEKEDIVEIRAPPKDSDIKAVPVTHMAKINTDPIDYLIYGERPRDIIKFFKNIKHRLHPSSVVVIVGNNPGLVQDLYNQVFPDISKRPNFVECINATHMGENSITGIWDTLRSIPIVKGKLLLGPLARTYDDGMTPGEVEKREQEVECLVNRVMDAPLFGAERIDRRGLERYKLKKLVARAVIYPLTVAFNCMMGEIFSTEERVTEARLLFDEACAVIQSVDETLTRRILLDNLLWAVVRQPNIRPIMLKCVDLGFDTNIDLDNGWIIKNAPKGMAPMNTKYSNIVKERARESAKAIAAEKEEAAKAEARLKVAREMIAKRMKENDTEEVIRRGFKRFAFGQKIEAPLNVPDKTYYRTRSPMEASGIWGKLEAPFLDPVKGGNESDPPARVGGGGDAVIQKTSE
ncbi:hypothetical protein BCIN_03g05920 [Botrytis cinerea B05.10]|uniref:Ketopantoate reductase C-terminal domain-containing protein n=4 Tax=Botryotinia fuckeliana TaxID=40559 RepID=A0A384JD72_BOTFB|nr:hypothetical protein BCIN_03g05920 [Botrytis cinerea B05.10]ATZ48367.1 hypothetical protein BCIN_03g05920 [Botrytis cinerea B05.10]EMR84280.1 putative 2-dehydropantoate 2-reductase protein [Botrytis cinerea BcDW1]